jgi:hypothetical protein
MNDKQLLTELLEAEYESDVIACFVKRGLFEEANAKRWIALGNMPNNQSVVHAQQSTPAAALVEKFTNGLDAILLRRCKAQGIDPRSFAAPPSMSKAVQKWFGDLDGKFSQEVRPLAEENLVLYATGSKSRPCLSFYDAGEGQLPDNFPSTFCSLIYGSDEGSYKGAVPFVQGRFNMGGTGVLPFCGDDRKMQLIVSRAPLDVQKSAHEWGFTVFCFFPSRQSPSWKYLVGTDGKIMTAGAEPLGLVPKIGAKAGEICAPRERKVPHGTLIKMYDYKAPRSNVCGELFRKLEEYLLRPMLPLRIIECRSEYKANVMGVTCGTVFRCGPNAESLRKDSRMALASRLSFRRTRPCRPRYASSRPTPTQGKMSTTHRQVSALSSMASHTRAATRSSLRGRRSIRNTSAAVCS